MGETDISFRHLLRGLPQPILRLAFPRRRLKPVGPPLDPSVDRPRQRTTDSLYRFRYHVVPLWRLDARRMQAQLGLQGAPFCAAMHGVDEAFVQDLADELRTDRGLTKRDRRSTMQLLYVVSAAILGSDTARRIFHVESIIQDPNVQELINEWKDKGLAEGRAKGLAKGRVEGRVEGRAAEARRLLHKVLAARSFRVTRSVRARIDGESSVACLESWLEAAVTARTISDVFRDD